MWSKTYRWISLNGLLTTSANNYLTFTDEEIPMEGRGHNKALHISVTCMDYVITHLLINNGSSLNMMSKATLNRLPGGGVHM